MPKRKKAWTSWNFIGLSDAQELCNEMPVCVTYWLNRLQNLNIKDDLFVTLNPVMTPKKDLIIKSFTLSHPFLKLIKITQH